MGIEYAFMTVPTPMDKGRSVRIRRIRVIRVLFRLKAGNLKLYTSEGAKFAKIIVTTLCGLCELCGD